MLLQAPDPDYPAFFSFALRLAREWYARQVRNCNPGPVFAISTSYTEEDQPSVFGCSAFGGGAGLSSCGTLASGFFATACPIV